MIVIIGGGGGGYLFTKCKVTLGRARDQCFKRFFLEGGGDVMLFYHFILFGDGCVPFFFLGRSLFIQYIMHCVGKKV